MIPDDPVTKLLAAMIAIVEGDADLRALFGRVGPTSPTTKIIVPWKTLATKTTTDVLAYHPLNARQYRHKTDRLFVQVSAFAKTFEVANKAVNYVPKILTLNAFVAKGISATASVVDPPDRRWDDADAEPGDRVEQRADTTLAFLFTV